MVDALDAVVGEGVLRAGVDRVDAEAFEQGVGEVRVKLKAVVGEMRDGDSPKRYVLVDEDADEARGGGLG